MTVDFDADALWERVKDFASLPPEMREPSIGLATMRRLARGNGASGRSSHRAEQEADLFDPLPAV